MIKYNTYTLDNGLRVLIHEDQSTPLVAINVAYNVGSKNEDPEKTGLAHLVEHLMFCGTRMAPNYDIPIQLAGGENNAYTTSDITNYYITLPSQNIETGIWIEADRMENLLITDESFETQRSVVIEEFKQNYLNQPYGDIAAIAKELAYATHPYQWATIGKSVEQLERMTKDDAIAFYRQFYCPSNAVVSISGSIGTEETLDLVRKWFEPIKKRNNTYPVIEKEGKQEEAKFVKVERNVPHDALYMCWHMCSRTDEDYHATDLISDVLSNGNSSRLYRRLVIEEQLFSELDAYISGENDEGLFVVHGKLSQNTTHEQAQLAVENEINQMKETLVSDYELQKVKNKVEANLLYSNMNFQSKASSLAIYEILGDANLINQQPRLYQAVSSEQIMHIAREIFTDKNRTTIHYARK